MARVASSQSTVLVIGESGTGKSWWRGRFTTIPARASGPFVAVNCTAISESLLESELFGHVKGAFTGRSMPSAAILKKRKAERCFSTRLAT